jgi:hypothetical protein
MFWRNIHFILKFKESMVWKELNVMDKQMFPERCVRIWDDIGSEIPVSGPTVSGLIKAGCSFSLSCMESRGHKQFGQCSLDYIHFFLHHYFQKNNRVFAVIFTDKLQLAS